MFKPSLKEFLSLARKGKNVIPVYKQISADLDTPVSAFLKLKKGDYSFLLESVEGQEKIARYSFLGADPYLIFQSKADKITIIYPQSKDKKQEFATSRDPLEEIKNIMHRFKAAKIDGLPRFFGGLVGYFSYDLVRFFERLPEKNPDTLNLPDSYFILTYSLIIFDHVNHTMKIVNNCILPEGKLKIPAWRLKKMYEAALCKINSIETDLKSPLRVRSNLPSETPKRFSSNVSKAAFLQMVKKAKDYIRKGDIIQVVLSQRFQCPIFREDFDLYRSLRSLNPSPYMFFLKFKGLTLLGASPEIHVRCEDNIARIRPIAGTRRRGNNEAEDKRLEEELLHDEKERAEHIMLVDLARNDLGRVCEMGKVRVSEFMSVERYSHVMHLVSEVEGPLRKNCDIYELLRASFPAGTVSGSPKVRAMEIIEELENTRRGPYAGCVGYFSFSHNVDSCITIRTILIKDKTAYIQAGAGVVADSVPEKEYRETVNKARALFEVLKRQ